MSLPDVNYWDYLRLPDLLKLQGGLENNENKMSEDELSFIVIHQVFELWFKLAIREITLATERMSQNKVDEELIPYVVHHLRRVNTILESAIKHFDLMETLTPQDFLVFRAKLGTASGFQSFQLRQLEVLLGLDEAQRNKYGHGNPLKYIYKTAESSDSGSQIQSNLDKSLQSVTLRDAIHKWLQRTPIDGSSPSDQKDADNVRHFIENYLSKLQKMNDEQISKFGDSSELEAIKQRFDASFQASKSFIMASDIAEGDRTRVSRIRTAILFIESYRELPLLSWPRVLIDTVVQLEELFVTFRFRHARMVERIIGRRVGTGGSSGVDYLDETTKYRVFPELWEVRTILVPKENLPELKNSQFYQFSSM